MCRKQRLRLPGFVKVILSHGDGLLPYAASRFAEFTASLTPDRSAASLLDDRSTHVKYTSLRLCQPTTLPNLSRRFSGKPASMHLRRLASRSINV